MIKSNFYYYYQNHASIELQSFMSSLRTKSTKSSTKLSPNQYRLDKNFNLVKELSIEPLDKKTEIRKNIYLSLIYHSITAWDVKYTEEPFLDSVFITNQIDLQNDFKLIIYSDLSYSNSYIPIIQFDDDIHILYNKSLLKSNLQKAIRLSLSNEAIISAFNLIKIDFIAFIRRLIIIAIEDVGIPENLDWLCWLMVAYPNYEINNNIIQHLLLTVYSLCEFKNEFIQPNLSTGYTAFSWINGNLNFVSSLFIRRCFGGMNGDMELIDNYIYSILNNQQMNIIPIINKKLVIIRNILHQDIINTSIDHHCYPDMIYSIYNDINRTLPANTIKNLLWTFSSSINIRRFVENDKKDESSISEYEDTKDDWELIKNKVINYQNHIKRNLKITKLTNN